MTKVISEIVHPGELAEFPANSNTHSKGNIEELAEGRRKFTQYKNIVVWRAPEETVVTLKSGKQVTLKPGIMYVIAGNGLHQASLKRRDEGIEIKDFSHLTYDEALLLSEHDNASALGSKIDPEQLRANLEKTRSLYVDNERLARVLQRARDAAGVVENGNEGDESSEAQIDRAEELQKKWQVRPGDLFEIGPHRLLCGDCRNPEDVGRLMDGGKAKMVFTDPPYNVEIVGGTRDPRDKKNYQSGNYIENDSMSDVEFDAFLFEAMQSLHGAMSPGCVFYVCSPAGNTETQFRNAINKVFTLRQCIVWVKQQFVFGRQDYHWRHESILYGWKEGAAHFFGEDHTQDTVWEIDRPMRSDKEHPTVKPVELPMRAIRNSSKEGDLVYDPFAGSGTTALAAHALNRRSASVEIHPPYVAVTLERFEQADLTPAKI